MKIHSLVLLRNGNRLAAGFELDFFHLAVVVTCDGEVQTEHGLNIIMIIFQQILQAPARTWTER